MPCLQRALGTALDDNVAQQLHARVCHQTTRAPYCVPCIFVIAETFNQGYQKLRKSGYLAHVAQRALPSVVHARQNVQALVDDK